MACRRDGESCGRDTGRTVRRLAHRVVVGICASKCVPREHHRLGCAHIRIYKTGRTGTGHQRDIVSCHLSIQAGGPGDRITGRAVIRLVCTRHATDGQCGRVHRQAARSVRDVIVCKPTPLSYRRCQRPGAGLVLAGGARAGIGRQGHAGDRVTTVEGSRGAETTGTQATKAIGFRLVTRRDGQRCRVNSLAQDIACAGGISAITAVNRSDAVAAGDQRRCAESRRGPADGSGSKDCAPIIESHVTRGAAGDGGRERDAEAVRAGVGRTCQGSSGAR